MSNVLYDAPGPKTRKRAQIASVIAVLVIVAGLYYFVYRPLEERDQFSMELWGPIIDPGNENFSKLWSRMGEGWIATFKAAVLAIILSFFFGTGLAILRAQLRGVRGSRYRERGPVVSYLLRGTAVGASTASRFWVEFWRGLPVVVTIFFVSKFLPENGFPIEDPMWYLVIGLTLYNSVVIGEVLRSGMDGLPHGQREAASSIGLSVGQSLRLIQLPQALRIMLPALISQAVVVLKDTSLGGLIVGNEEALRVARGIVEVLYNPIQMYFVVAVQYILVCYAVSRLAVAAERWSSRRGLPPAPNTVDIPLTVLAVQQPGVSGLELSRANVPQDPLDPRDQRKDS